MCGYDHLHPRQPIMKTIRRVFLLAILTGQLTLIGLRLWKIVRPLVPYWKQFQQVRPAMMQTLHEVRGIQRNIRG